MNLKEKLNVETAAVAIGTTVVVLLFAVVVFGPLAVIWSLNQLIPVAAIPYNFYTWLSVIILKVLTSSSLHFKNEKLKRSVPL